VRRGGCAVRRVTLQLKGASRLLCLPGLPVAVKLADRYLGLAPKANIIRSASADRLKGTNYGHLGVNVIAHVIKLTTGYWPLTTTTNVTQNITGY